MSDNKPAFVLLPEGVLSFPKFDKLQYSDDDVNKENGKFSCNVIYPPAADLGKLKKEIQAAAIAKFGAEKCANPGFREKLYFPIRKGSTYTDAEGNLRLGYEAESQVIPVSFYNPMTFLDQYKNKIASDSKQAVETFYPGCKVTIAVTAHGFDNPKKKGVTLRLYAFMKTGEGERLGGSAVGNPDDVFAGVAAQAASPVEASAGTGEDWV